MDTALLAASGHDRTATRNTLLQNTVEAVFRRTEENRLLSIRLRNGQQKVLYRSDLISGAILAAIVQRAKERAVERAIQEQNAPGYTPPDKSGGGNGGITLDDLLLGVQAEYREGEILPPDEAAEEWLKLLDHHPDQVVGVTSFRKGRGSEERLVSII